MIEPTIETKSGAGAGGKLQSMDEEINIVDLLKSLWGGKWVIVMMTAIFSVVGVVYSLSLPNIYRAQVLLVPANTSDNSGLSSIAGQFGGLASLAGVSLRGNGRDKAQIGIEVMKSRGFITDFVNRRAIQVPLIAGQSWDPKSRQLTIDRSVYDTQSNEWLRDSTTNESKEPSDWDTYKAFRDLLAVNYQKDVGLVAVSIDFISPKLAKQWVSWLVQDLNNHMKEADIRGAERSIDYLQQELVKTSVAELQSVFYQLIEKQIQTKMLANVQPEYVFETIDPALEPEEKFSPKRAILCVMMAFVGFLIGVIVVLVRNAFFRASNSANV